MDEAKQAELVQTSPEWAVSDALDKHWKELYSFFDLDKHYTFNYSFVSDEGIEVELSIDNDFGTYCAIITRSVDSQTGLRSERMISWDPYGYNMDYSRYRGGERLYQGGVVREVTVRNEGNPVLTMQHGSLETHGARVDKKNLGSEHLVLLDHGMKAIRLEVARKDEVAKVAKKQRDHQRQTGLLVERALDVALVKKEIELANNKLHRATIVFESYLQGMDDQTIVDARELNLDRTAINALYVARRITSTHELDQTKEILQELIPRPTTSAAEGQEK